MEISFPLVFCKRASTFEYYVRPESEKMNAIVSAIHSFVSERTVFPSLVLISEEINSPFDCEFLILPPFVNILRAYKLVWFSLLITSMLSSDKSNIGYMS